MPKLKSRNGHGRRNARPRNPELANEWPEMEQIVDDPLPIVRLRVPHDWLEASNVFLG